MTQTELLKEKIVVLEELVKFYGEIIDGHAVYLHVHNIHESEDNIQKGKDLRVKLASLTDQINEVEKEQSEPQKSISTELIKYMGNWTVKFIVGNQSFVLYNHGNKKNALWMQEMLIKAFSNFVSELSASEPKEQNVEEIINDESKKSRREFDNLYLNHPVEPKDVRTAEEIQQSEIIDTQIITYFNNHSACFNGNNSPKIPSMTRNDFISAVKWALSLKEQ